MIIFQNRILTVFILVVVVVVVNSVSVDSKSHSGQKDGSNNQRRLHVGYSTDTGTSSLWLAGIYMLVRVLET